MNTRSPDRLTKKDTVALWHAVQAFSKHIDYILRLEGVEEDMLQDERRQLVAARAALRFVSASRNASSRADARVSRGGVAAPAS